MRNLSVQRHVERHLPLLLQAASASSPADRSSQQQQQQQQQHVVIVDLCSVAADGTEEDRIVLTSNGLLARVSGSDGTIAWTTSLNDAVNADNNEGAGADGGAADCGGGGWFDVACVYGGDATSVVCLSSRGAIVSASPDTGAAELVGEFDNGIEAGSWSPDGEVLALVTAADDADDADAADAEAENDDGGEQATNKKKSVLLSMNTQWEVLAEVDIEPHLPSHQATSSSSSDTTTTTNNNRVSLCWRPDGTRLAVSSVDASDSTRKIRIYGRDALELAAVGRTEDGSGKLVPNLQSTRIAWAGPNCSQLVAAVQRKGKKTLQVSFFEPNGLRHRELVLRGGDNSATEVLGLDWSADSDLLAVTVRDNNDNADKVQVWHRCNYHWYLKKELRFSSSDRKVVRAKFHPEHPSTLFVIFDGGARWNEYGFRWDASAVLSTGLRAPNSSTAFVVDGRVLNTTPLDAALVPPPMYAAALELESPVSHVVLSRRHGNHPSLSSPSSSSIAGVAILSDGRCAVVERGGIGNNNKKSELVPSYDPPTIRSLAEWGPTTTQDLDPISFRDFVLVGEGANNNGDNDILHMVAIAPAPHGGSCESLVEILLSPGGEDNGNKAEATVTGRIQLEGRVLRMIPWLDSADGALLQLEDGQLLEYERGSVVPSQAEPLLEPCPWIAALRDLSSLCDSDSQGHIQQRRLVVGLSSKSRLYCHDLLLSDYASSFVLSPWQKYLCYTTSGSRGHLRFLSLPDLHDFDPLMGSDGNELLEGYEPRNVERGATIVAVLPHKPTTVLQLPRGNLEAVFPRALVLRHVVLKISEGDFKGAFEMMRRQKVDPNLMVDLDPRRFLESGGYAETLVDHVSNIDHLNLFISSLQKVDSTQTRFVIPSWWLQGGARDKTEKEPFDYEEKVNRTCQVLRSIMIQAEKDGKTKGGREIKEGHFLLPILSTFAKEDPPKLDAALSLIKENALAKHSPASKKPTLFSESAQHSIQYLAFLADYELLFETALGMYEYDVARAVARNSQMDPKVYLPMLKRYRELPTYFARCEVDIRLKRYESALRNLFESGIVGESVDNLQDDGLDESIRVGNGFDQCLALIEEHNLHQLGLQLFQDEGQKSQIMLSLGNHLLKEKQASAALNVFLASTPPFLERAKDAARSCRDWGAFFTVLAIESSSIASEDRVARQRNLARQVANELIADAEGHFNRRMSLADAARVLLDYADDANAAVEVLLKAEMWNEAHRISLLYDREDLVQETVDGAVSYANVAMNDLEEKGDAFCAANARFAEVLELRKDSVMKGETQLGGAPETDDTGSLFSAASNVSHLSMASNASTGTISSVISAKSTTSFTLSGADEVNRHKSKFNQLGDRQNKNARRKKKGGRSRKSNKARPGSQQELDGLVGTLRSNCVDESYRDVLAETITFLARNGQIGLAQCLYNEYIAVSAIVKKSQTDRLETAEQEQLREEKRARKEGIVDSQPKVTIEAEKEVDVMAWVCLPDKIQRLFSFLPNSFGS